MNPTQVDSPPRPTLARDSQPQVDGQDDRFGAQSWQPALQWLAQQIADHPGISLGVAVAVGVTLGWMIKRR
jgi:ElaB/YqjD/DUF883 family membrane-anchored ribosome-binding protein